MILASLDSSPLSHLLQLDPCAWGKVCPPAQEFGKRSGVFRILMPTAPTRTRLSPTQGTQLVRDSRKVRTERAGADLCRRVGCGRQIRENARAFSGFRGGRQNPPLYADDSGRESFLLHVRVAAGKRYERGLSRAPARLTGSPECFYRASPESSLLVMLAPMRGHFG